MSLMCNIYAIMDLFFKRVHLRLVEIERKRPWLLGETNINPSTWSSWEKNGRVPPADRALAIADALGVSLEFLLTGRETAFDMRQSNPLVVQIFNQLKFLDDLQLRKVLTVVNTMRLEGSQS
jgi:transcriptional regulator with XRE-family HTH domain